MSNDDDFIYSKFEDQIFMQKALKFFTFESNSSKSHSGIANKVKDFQHEIPHRLVN